MRLFGGLLVLPDFEYTLGVCATQLYLVEPARLATLRADALIVPVNTDLWLGGPIGKIVRDACGDVVQDRARRLPPLGPGQAVAVRAGRGPVRNVILTNIYDVNKLTSVGLMGKALDAAMTQANEVHALTASIPDFTEEFNYFANRSDASVAAIAIAAALERNETTVRLAKIAVFNKANLDIYKQAICAGGSIGIEAAY